LLDDVFVENFVKREKTAMNAVFNVLCVALTILIIFMVNVIPILFGLNIFFFTGAFSFLIGFLCYLLIGRQNIEYEIALTNDNFSVTKILGERKRVLLADFGLKECKRIAPVTSEDYKSDYEKAELHLNTTSRKEVEISDSNWYCLVSSDGITYIVIFEFKEKMYKAFRRYNPRNTYFMRITDKKDEEI